MDRGPPGPPASLYVHVPFCRDRCTYCGFATLADDPHRHAALVEALLTETRRPAVARLDIAALQTVYLGGGTPSLLAPELLGRLLSALRERFGFADGAEITLEANPAEIDRESLAAWTGLGVTRLSVGVQTFRDDVLAGFGRHHDGADARRALETLQRHWTRDWSADLLVGWAGQQPDDTARDVASLIGFEPPHVAVYGLTVEPGTPLAELAAAGREVAAPPARHVELDRAWHDALVRAGYERYEVSNYCRDGRRSRHNQAYWANASYLGLGPGASSSVHPHRWSNHRDLSRYLESVDGIGPRAACETVAPEARLLESLAVGLRTRDGLSVDELDRRFGRGWRGAPPGLADLFARGALLEEHGRLRVPEAGLLTVDRLMAGVAASWSVPGGRHPAPEGVSPGEDAATSTGRGSGDSEKPKGVSL